MTERRTVSFGGGSISYTLERKRVKNLNLRVRQDGSVYASAGRRVPAGEVDRFVTARGAFILRAQQHFAARLEQAPPPHRYESGEVFRLLGAPLTLTLIAGKPEGVTRTERGLTLTTAHPEDCAKKGRLMTAWWRGECLSVFSDAARRLLPLLSPYGVAMPVLRVRTMKSRWGSCLPKGGVVTLNTRLLEAPPACVDYVVLHELCHLVHPNHSAAFHSLMDSLMPDWRERKGALERQATF